MVSLLQFHISSLNGGVTLALCLINHTHHISGFLKKRDNYYRFHFLKVRDSEPSYENTSNDNNSCILKNFMNNIYELVCHAMITIVAYMSRTTKVYMTAMGTGMILLMCLSLITITNHRLILLFLL